MYRVALPTKNYPVQSVNNAIVEKPGVGVWAQGGGGGWEGGGGMGMNFPSFGCQKSSEHLDGQKWLLNEWMNR